MVESKVHQRRGTPPLKRDPEGPRGPLCEAKHGMDDALFPEGVGMLLATSGPYTPRTFSVLPSGGLIGRSRKCQISLLHDCEVSHNHAVIEPAQGGILCIRDVGSTFGTYLNDKRLSEPKRVSMPHKLKACDSIKVGQTSLRWQPIELIKSAVAVAIPESPRPPSDWLSQLQERKALLPDEWSELAKALERQHEMHHSLFPQLCKAIVPVDLPLLLRRVEQVRHVQVRALEHGCTLRRSLGPLNSAAYMLGAEAIAATTLAVTVESAAMHDAATAAARAAGWRPEDPGLSRLRELLRESTAMRSESALAQVDQSSRLEPLIAALAQYAASLTQQGPLLGTNALLPRLIASLGARAKAPPPGLLEMRRRLHAAAAAANLALDLAMLAKSWLARVHTCVRVPERATSQVTELLKNRRHLRTVLEAKRQQLNSLRASLAKALPTSTTEAPTAMEVDHGGNETTATWPPLARSAARAASMVQLDDAKARERTAAAQSWELRQAIASAQVGLRRQEAALCWLLCSGVPEAVLQLLPGLPNLIQDLECQEELDDGAGAASGDSGQDLVGGGPLTLVLAHSLIRGTRFDAGRLTCGLLTSPGTAHLPLALAWRLPRPDRAFLQLNQVLALYAGTAPSSTEKLDGAAVDRSTGWGLLRGAGDGGVGGGGVGGGGECGGGVGGGGMRGGGTVEGGRGGGGTSGATEDVSLRDILRGSDPVEGASYTCWAGENNNGADADAAKKVGSDALLGSVDEWSGATYPVGSPCLACFIHDEPVEPLADRLRRSTSAHFNFLHPQDDDKALYEPPLTRSAPRVCCVILSARLRDQRCRLSLHASTDVRASRDVWLGVRELQRQQHAGCDGACCVVNIKGVWCEALPAAHVNPHEFSTWPTAGSETNPGPVAVCVQTDPACRTLRDLLQHRRGVDTFSALPVLRSVCTGLAALHAHGLSCAGRIGADCVLVRGDGNASLLWPPDPHGVAPTMLQLAASEADEHEFSAVDAAWAEAALDPARSDPAHTGMVRDEPFASTASGAGGMCDSHRDFAADVWALGMLLWRVCVSQAETRAAEAPPTLAPGASGLVPPIDSCTATTLCASAAPVAAILGSAAKAMDLKDILARMLRVTPSERPTAAELLAHPFLATQRFPSCSSDAPRPVAAAAATPAAAPSLKMLVLPLGISSLQASSAGVIARLSGGLNSKGTSGDVIGSVSSADTMERDVACGGTPSSNSGSRVGDEISAILHELRRARSAATGLAPLRYTLRLSCLSADLLDFVGELGPDELCRSLELSLFEDFAAASLMGSNTTDCGALLDSPSLRPLTVEEALRLFWRACTDCGSGSVNPPLWQMPLLPSVQDCTPGLPPDAVLPCTDAAMACQDGRAKHFEYHHALGRLLFLSIAHSIPLPSWLPLVVYKALLQRVDTVGLSDLQICRPRLACRCALVLSSVVSGEFDAVDTEDPPIPAPSLCATTPVSTASCDGGGGSRYIGSDGIGAAEATNDLETVAEYKKLEAAHRVLRWRLIECRGGSTEALARGFASALPAQLRDLLCHVSVEAWVLAAGACGRELSVDELLATVHFEGWGEETPTPSLLVGWLRQISPLERRRFVLLLTGRVAPAAPPRGGGGAELLWDGVITVRPMAGDLSTLLPRALRASWELLLPHYADEEQLAAAMESTLLGMPEGHATL